MSLKSSWRNWLARSTVNREVVGSIPTEDASFFLSTQNDHSVDFAQATEEPAMWKRGMWSMPRYRRAVAPPAGSFGRAADAYKNAKDAALAEFLSFLDAQKQKRGFLQRLLDKKMRRSSFAAPDDIGFGTFERRAWSPTPNWLTRQ